jgi:hypothetical protein
MTNTEKIKKLRDRFIAWLRSQPRGFALTTAEVCEWLYLPDDHLVDVVLAPVKDEGVVKVREVGRGSGGRLWSLA